MLIRKLSAIAAICGFCSMSSPAMAEELSVKEMLLKQQKQIEALQKKIAQQEAVHNEALTHYIKNEVDRAVANHSGSLLTLGSNVENLTFKGDFRVRFEDRNRDTGADTDRFRQRVRLGFLWKTTDGWEIGAGLITGSDNPRSGNDTYGSTRAFETGDIRLDYAFAKHTFESGMTLTLGQMKNPFISSSLLWDSDIRPVGVALQNQYDSGVFYTIGGFQVKERGDENTDAQLFAGQVGYAAEGLTAALTYYHFNDASTRETTLVGDATSENDVNAVSAYVSFAGKTDDFKYKVFGEYTHNLGSDDGGTTQAGTGNPDSEETAWLIGTKIDIDKFSLGYTYAHFEADAFVGNLTNTDFGSAIAASDGSNNVEGHIFTLGYKVTKNFSVASKFVYSEAIEDSGSGNDDGELFQLDFKYKF